MRIFEASDAAVARAHASNRAQNLGPVYDATHGFVFGASYNSAHGDGSHYGHDDQQSQWSEAQPAEPRRDLESAAEYEAEHEWPVQAPTTALSVLASRPLSLAPIPMKRKAARSADADADADANATADDDATAASTTKGSHRHTKAQEAKGRARARGGAKGKERGGDSKRRRIST